MAIALLEIPVSGWTCLRTEERVSMKRGEWHERVQLTLVDVRRVSLLADLAALLLLAVSGRHRLSLLRGLRALRGRLGRRL